MWSETSNRPGNGSFVKLSTKENLLVAEVAELKQN